MASSKKPTINMQVVKKGRRTYGAIYTLPDGRVIYLAWRKIREIFRSGELSISAAIRAGKAAWALDDETLLMLKAKKIQFAGILVRETQDVFLTRTEHFFDKTKAKIMNYSGRGGALQRYLPLAYFMRRPGKVKF